MLTYRENSSRKPGPRHESYNSRSTANADRRIKKQSRFIWTAILFYYPFNYPSFSEIRPHRKTQDKVHPFEDNKHNEHPTYCTRVEDAGYNSPQNTSKYAPRKKVQSNLWKKAWTLQQSVPIRKAANAKPTKTFPTNRSTNLKSKKHQKTDKYTFIHQPRARYPHGALARNNRSKKHIIHPRNFW